MSGRWARWCALAAFVAGAAVAPAAGVSGADSRLRVPFFKQQKNGCGAASVAMVVHYWRGHVREQAQPSPTPENIYQRLYRSGRGGIPLADMRSYLEEIGFDAFTLRGRWTDVEGNLAKGRPAIVGLKKKAKGGMHFAVVVGADAAHVYLNDPTRKSAKRMRRAEFDKQWGLAEQWVLLAAPARLQALTRHDN